MSELPTLKEHPDYLVNIDDLESNFWKHDYLVTVTSQGITFLVNASCEGDALDAVMDHIVDMELTGLYSKEYIEDYEPITAGNYGYLFTTHNIRIQKL